MTSLSYPQKAALLDELKTTHAAWPSVPCDEYGERVYGEALAPFTPDEIRAGFRAARSAAKDFPPKPARILDACNMAARQLRRPPSTGHDTRPCYQCVATLDYTGPRAVIIHEPTCARLFTSAAAARSGPDRI